MPYYSGGGSNHSRGSYSGGSYNSRNNNKSYISKKPFLNSKKFRYYDKNGKAHYIYSTQMPEKTGISNLISVLVIFSLFLFGGISIASSSLKSSIDFASIIFLIIWFALILAGLFFFLRDYFMRRKVYEEVPTEDAVGNNSDFYYQTGNQKNSQDHLKSGGGYILNGEYYDPSKKD